MAGREGADRHEASELISQSLPCATTPSLHFPSLPRRGCASACHAMAARTRGARGTRDARDASEIRGFGAAVLKVRIHLPPAVSLRTIGSRNTKSSVTEPPPGATPICVRPAKLKERGEVKARGALRHALAATPLDRANNSAFAHDTSSSPYPSPMQRPCNGSRIGVKIGATSVSNAKQSFTCPVWPKIGIHD